MKPGFLWSVVNILSDIPMFHYGGGGRFLLKKKVIFINHNLHKLPVGRVECYHLETGVSAQLPWRLYRPVKSCKTYVLPY